MTDDERIADGWTPHGFVIVHQGIRQLRRFRSEEAAWCACAGRELFGFKPDEKRKAERIAQGYAVRPWGWSKQVKP